MRLIDADRLKQQIAAVTVKNGYDVGLANRLCEIINNQPTALDVDELMERLDEYANGNICYQRMCPEDSCEQCGALGAIEVVRNCLPQ